MSDLDPSLDDVVGKRLDQKLVSRLLTFARPHAGAMSLTVFLLIAGMALRLLGPWLIQRLLDGPVDEAFKNRNTPGFDSAPLLDQVAEFAGIFLLVTLASGTVGDNLIAFEFNFDRHKDTAFEFDRTPNFHFGVRPNVERIIVGCSSHVGNSRLF